MSDKPYSILFRNNESEFITVSDVTMHDLALDSLVRELSGNDKEQRYISMVLSRVTKDTSNAKYRADVFEDLLNNKGLRDKMAELLDHVEFIRDFGSFKKDFDDNVGIWELLHRIDDINDYIRSVEAMRECLNSSDIHSEGLLGLRKYIEDIYEDGFFSDLKKDIGNIRAEAGCVQSVTVGINVNARFEACEMGLVSINNKPFKKSNFVSNFTDAIQRNKNGVRDVKEGSEWDGDMHYQIIEPNNGAGGNAIEKFGNFLAMQSTPLVDNTVRTSMVKLAMDDSNTEVTCYMDKIASKLLAPLIKKVKDIMSKYVRVSIFNIINLIPEFMYYIRFSEYIEQQVKNGYHFCRPEPSSDIDMEAKGLYNLKLIKNTKPEDIVYNNLNFDREHTVYILTGANRGGKTTITQAVGQLFILAQGGIYVNADEFQYRPVDNIFTHFPADEDKTLDLGRLGEECQRFREMYEESTGDSLMLLNETFSTTSFEEGYYIARDSIRAIMKKGVRTIYNTHMHKLGYDVNEFNSEDGMAGLTSSLVVKTDGSKRSFKAVISEPEGLSYAGDIAAKYGVTFDMLTGGKT